ncbi:prenyltransferase [Streptomyces sp. TRM S81-3]|uniref:Prenyltransferase n=1 Tax=Streptomyces griseicoloratus TaxID=2752516 RepID=A0A926L3G6_9ACTN|nr:tryptophan dimethylallyltransferase family protein [Streptomyces griseicoloratus]MBD0421847.1 prenyltransferase [Streptomyces griseicoloratus]
MSGGPTHGGRAGTPTLGSFTSGQLRRLGAVAGLSAADVETYAHVLTESLGPVGERPLDLPPPTRTFLSDDHTPVEFSLSFQPGAAPSLRVLLEPGCGADSLALSGRAGLETVRAMARRWHFATDPLDEVLDLFLPPSPQGPLALWCALELRHGGVPAVKIYLNPAASGAQYAAATVREALHRLGHRRAFAALPEADGYPFLALDLGDWDTPRVKLYLRHDNLTAVRAGRLSRMDSGPHPAAVEEFFLTAAGGTGRHTTRLGRRPGLTCHSFTDTGAARPSGFTLHIPVRDYARHDGEALARATGLLHRHGMDAAVLTRALAAVTDRRPEDGVGLIAYLALAHQQGRPPRVTAYLSCEAYAVRPPVVEAARHAVAAR